MAAVEGDLDAFRPGQRGVDPVHHEGRPRIDEAAPRPAQGEGGVREQGRAAGAEPEASARDVQRFRHRLGQLRVPEVGIPVDAGCGGGDGLLHLRERRLRRLVGTQLGGLPDPVEGRHLLDARPGNVRSQGLDIRPDAKHPLRLPTPCPRESAAQGADRASGRPPTPERVGVRTAR